MPCKGKPLADMAGRGGTGALGFQANLPLTYTIGIDSSSGDDALFVYLSFEHPFKR
jgi:hypothetical protein